ncbi:MAG: cysteine hydrolase family protein [Candidatus Binataceae bacterium]
MITISARPEPIAIDTAMAAVLVVDMQNDFAAKGGMFERAGIDVSGIRAAVIPTARVLVVARAVGIPVIYIKMGHQPDLSDLGPDYAPHAIRHRKQSVGEKVKAPGGRDGRILVRDTWNTEIVPELTPEPRDIIVHKHRYSAFFETKLDSTLRTLGARYLIVTGCTTSICVESTIRDAMFRDYSCVLLEDCTAEPVGAEFSRSNHDASILTIERLMGWVSDSNKLIEAFGVR